MPMSGGAAEGLPSPAGATPVMSALRAEEAGEERRQDPKSGRDPRELTVEVRFLTTRHRIGRMAGHQDSGQALSRPRGRGRERDTLLEEGFW